MSVPTRRLQSDSVLENHMLVALGKEDGKGGSECDNKGRKTWGRERGEGDEGSQN